MNEHQHKPASQCQETARQWCECGARRKQLSIEGKPWMARWSEWMEPMSEIKPTPGEQTPNRESGGTCVVV